ncbi:MAG TPA: 2-amino-4-hydroxy-6-hydroxymethyldihydropteridine diphosphokinase [Opitutaceae bacterium]|nr:2-amino-4-hydroxy-6-hydroxymethyldihydropteridine diphosphokinase [Opitutaceae bacterium]
MSSRSRQAFVGVGANLGDRWAAIRRAKAALARVPGIAGVEASAVYETAPVGVLDQPEFLNLVLGIETTLAPEVLLAVLHRLEQAAGRRREKEVRWGPRALDLDLLLYEGETRTGPDLTLPHPRMWERAFVTVPLRELVARLAWFDRPAWAEARARLAAPPATEGVRRWQPPPA